MNSILYLQKDEIKLINRIALLLSYEFPSCHFQPMGDVAGFAVVVCKESITDSHEREMVLFARGCYFGILSETKQK